MTPRPPSSDGSTHEGRKRGKRERQPVGQSRHAGGRERAPGLRHQVMAPAARLLREDNFAWIRGRAAGVSAASSNMLGPKPVSVEDSLTAAPATMSRLPAEEVTETEEIRNAPQATESRDYHCQARRRSTSTNPTAVQTTALQRRAPKNAHDA